MDRLSQRHRRSRVRASLRLAAALGGALTAGAVRPACAQEADTPVNFAGWYEYEGNHRFVEGGRWGLLVEATVKRNDVIVDPMALFARFGLANHWGDHRVAGGYAFQYNEPYDSASPPYDYWEHRVWEQLELDFALGSNPRSRFSHRFRIEQRWLERRSSPVYSHRYWDFENTLRYRAQVEHAFAERWAFLVSDELHLRVPPPKAEHLVDQNRLALGFSIDLDAERHWKLKPGYMLQTYFESAETEAGLKRINHTLRITLACNLPFRTAPR